MFSNCRISIFQLTCQITVLTLIFLGSPSLLAQKKFLPPQCIHIIQEDEEDRRLSYPSSLFYESVKNEIYIVDSGHNRILVYTSDFFPFLTLDKDDGIQAPICATVDPEGYLFVGQATDSHHSRARISVFNPCLKWERDILFEGFEGAEKFVPKNLALDEKGRVYVAGTDHTGIVIFNKEGRYLSSIKPEDKFMGVKKKVAICDVIIDREGRIYLLSEEMGRVYVYNKKGDLILKFGQKGGSSGKLSRPRGFSMDKRNGRIYIIDYMRHTSSVYEKGGGYLFEFGGKGWGRGWFQFPSDICVDGAGNVLIADTFNHRVQVLEVK